ncbi:MAG: molybdopterin-dependent oxidoreductase [Rhodospirillaceae bacterium]|jgi:anaerobic selenocysteine-containing dehydrogenase|nr:molybdopterin-dependent oxidoreductase [Rhodospirillaceae bacterium]MBT4940919.1 molybdopterin-dependent oxidoreductase [Rhodospirillaceae bacterium]MBT5938689.1 molybdopterin-dependent oxidoreductase [Rhodospirillaceae bacterium]MBT7268639.1 molybdopterin-dependent oxidoreductase [Rhodospirillaceae bacterium]
MDNSLFSDQLTVRAESLETLPDGVHKSTCRMCHGGCGTLIHVKDREVVKVEGNPDSPLNEGRLCPMGASSMEQLYSPARLKYPMRRVGDRGEGKWERISWDEATDEIAARLTEITKESGAEAIAIGTGTGRHHCNWVPRFANALGTPNWGESGGAQCFFPRVNTMKLTYGEHMVCDYTGDRLPECILFWGHNPIYSSPDGELGFRVKNALAKQKPKTIVVDPRETMLAKKADVWLRVRPGTDDALGLAFIHTLIFDDLYDKEFVEKYTHGFAELKERVRDKTPEWASEITWVPAEKIREAAKIWAETKPGVLEFGCAIEHTPNALQTVRALSMLPALVGNVDVPGAWVFGMQGHFPFPNLIEALPEEQLKKRLGYDEFKILCSNEGSPQPSAHMPTVFKAMRTGEPYRVRAFCIFGNNPIASYADTKKMYETLQALDFFVVADLYLTPSAELADIVLPAASWMEVDEVVGMPYFSESVVLAQQKAYQLAECRNDEWMFVEIARKMGLEHGTEAPEEIFDQMLTKQGMTFKELKEKGHFQIEQTYNQARDGGFNTPSGKIELYATEFEKLGLDPLPYYEEPPESPLQTPELAKEFPFVLTSGSRIPMFFNSEYRMLPSLRKGRPFPEVDINPKTAAELGIEPGDWVKISTQRGTCVQRAKLTPGIDPRVAHVQSHWWFPEEAAPHYGIWKSNANRLTSQDGPYDPGMGTYHLRGMLCSLEMSEEFAAQWSPPIHPNYQSNAAEVQDWILPVAAE